MTGKLYLLRFKGAIMEINITQFFNSACFKDYSASVAEIGNNAGADTWRAACDDSSYYMMLDTDEKQEAFKDYVRGFGAWTDEEINAWSSIEVNALFIQLVSGDIREHEVTVLPEGKSVESFYFGPNGQVYFYVGD
jgi:hypothetical protein